MNKVKGSWFGIIKMVVLSVISILLLNACAKIVSPTGGEKDETPPAIIDASAEFPATNFDDDEIVFQFDEFINVDLNKIIFSPRIEEKPEIKVRGKNLIIELPENLDTTYTYTLNFNEAIKDYNENNPIENFDITFTSKAKIDSANIMGRVTNTFTHQAEGEVSIGLYPLSENFSDSIFTKKPSLYFTETDAQGNFMIKGIAPKSYQLFALKDENKNNLFENGESIALYDAIISFEDTTTVANIELKIFPTVKKELIYISETENVSRETLLIKLNQAIEKYDVQTISKSPNDTIWVKETTEPTENITIHHQISDSIQLELSQLEGLEKSIIDTFWIKKDTSLYEQNILPLESTQELTTLPYFEAYEMEFMIPAKKIDNNKIIVEQVIDSVYAPITVMPSIENGKLQIIKEWGSAEEYKITYLPESVIGVNNTSLVDTLIQKVKIEGIENYANMILIAGDSIINTGDYYYQLMSGKKMIFEGALQSEETIDNIEEGNYELIIFFDENKNNKWDTGTLFPRKEPEKTYVFKNIEMKKNWDISIQLKW